MTKIKQPNFHKNNKLCKFAKPIFYLHGIKAGNPILPTWVVNQNTKFTLSCQGVMPVLQKDKL